MWEERATYCARADLFIYVVNIITGWCVIEDYELR